MSPSFYDQVLTKTEGFSLTHKMSHQIANWDSARNAHLVKKISVRILGFATLPVLGLIDTVAHAALFVGKLGLGLCFFPPNLVITLLSRKSLHHDLILKSAFIDLNLFMQGSLHTMTLWIVVLFSPAKTSSIAGKHKEDIEKSKQVVNKLTNEVEEVKKRNKDLTDKQLNSENEINNLNVNIKNLNDRNDQLQKDNNAQQPAYQVELNERDRAIVRLSKQVENLNAEKTAQEKVLVVKSDEIERQESLIHRLQNDLQTQNPDLHSLRNEIANFQEELKKKSAENSNLRGFIYNLEYDVSTLNGELAYLRANPLIVFEYIYQ